ncbi:porin [Roseateles sp.]|uniref:porin n=1 Tax=Roseateles sp. TaxID=1971397 RepID=UPI0025F14EA8|nr:porin [Roseateles sp.]MBV8037464.1 porin [Roseateles sp.]
MNTTHTAIALATALAAGTAHAADFKAGEWDIALGGIVNAYYTHTSCSGSQAVDGVALASKGLGCGGTDGRTVIGNGLLPNALTTMAKTRQEGLDISATLMIGAAVASGDAISNNSNVDVRQGFMTFGNADIGSVKLGRDYGLFGSSAILGDMTLLGAGAPVSATQRNRVTLGHIGSGYTYLGTYGQVAYTLPVSGNFSATVALMSPVDAGSSHIGRNEPQLQALATARFGGGKAWLGVKHQKFEGVGGAAGFTMNGAEVGASVTLGALGLAANIQSGKGLGVLTDGDSGNRKQTNLLLQATWQATAKTKLGLNWGESRLKDGTASDLRGNSNVTAGLYYGLTKSVTLVTELSRTMSRPVVGNEARMNGVALGGIVFF